jgi:hypothetical protein
LPTADGITMGIILHDWNLEKKPALAKAAFDGFGDAFDFSGADFTRTEVIDLAGPASACGACK